MNPLYTVIVLAAGASARFVGPGQETTGSPGGLDDELTVLGLTLRNVLASRLPVVVVAAAAVAPLAGRLLGADRVSELPSQRSGGLGDWIAAGVLSRPESAGWLVLPGDMTRVQPQTLVRVAEALRSHAVAYAQLRGRRGHPVGFSAELYSELVALTGDEGARRLVARYPAEAVQVDDVGVLLGGDALQEFAVPHGVQEAPAAAREHVEPLRRA